MVTKTYKAETMLDALTMIQNDLGPDAIVVSTRDVPLGPAWNIWKQTGIEIVAATADALPGLAGARPAAKEMSVQAQVLRATPDRAGIEFVEEKPQIEWVVSEPVTTTSAALPPQPVEAQPQPWLPRRLNTGELKSTSRPAEGQPAAGAQPRQNEAPKPVTFEKNIAEKNPESAGTVPPALQKLQRRLMGQGMDKNVVERMLNVALETFSQAALQDDETCKKYLARLLEAELRVQPGLGLNMLNKVVCLVGASGSGKTSTLAKLAMFFRHKLEKKVTWVCADTNRTGAIAEARAFTDALGIPFKLAYTPADLHSIVENSQETDLILIDTSGYNPCVEDQMVELGALLAEIPQRCTYLAAPATTKEADLFQLAASLGVFNLDGVIVTKLDETYTYGSVYNFARKCQLPLSYFTTGKDVDRDLEVVNPARLVSALLGKGWN